MDLDNATERQLREALNTEISALEYIKDGDPGPSYHVAKRALEEMEEDLKRLRG